MKIMPPAKHCHVDMSPACSMSSLARNQLEQVQMIVTKDSKAHDVDKLEYQKPAYVAVGLILAITSFAVCFPMVISSRLLGMQDKVYTAAHPAPCTDQCVLGLVESIPDNLTFPAGSPSHTPTFAAWQQLVQSARSSIHIAALYWTLRGTDVYSDPSDWQGERIYQSLHDAAQNRGIKIRIATDATQPHPDTVELAKLPGVEVRTLDFRRWFGGGVLHTKLWIVDGAHFYVGSANMDWRSLTQVKELGVAAYNCSCLASDVEKLFSVYWYLGAAGAAVPARWPDRLATAINSRTPLTLTLNTTGTARVYLASSPPALCPRGRTGDLDALLDVISRAERYVHIAVMDYFPTTLYTHPRRFWPVIDDALRRAAVERGVAVRVLASWWNHTRPDLPVYLSSLQALTGPQTGADIHVRLFRVPAFTDAQKNIPFARVNHNKYMVTDNAAYIGTSNWSGDYFTVTGGVSLVLNQTAAAATQADNTTADDQPASPGTAGPNVQQQLSAVFDRDWNSPYAHEIEDIGAQDVKADF